MFNFKLWFTGSKFWEFLALQIPTVGYIQGLELFSAPAPKYPQLDLSVNGSDQRAPCARACQNNDKLYSFLCKPTDSSQYWKHYSGLEPTWLYLAQREFYKHTKSKCFQGSLLLFGHELSCSNREFTSCNLRAQLVKIINRISREIVLLLPELLTSLGLIILDCYFYASWNRVSPVN